MVILFLNKRAPASAWCRVTAGHYPSARNVAAGSTLSARRAGMNVATSAAIPRITATTPNAIGSNGLRPNRNCSSNGPVASDMSKPADNPASRRGDVNTMPRRHHAMP